LSGSDPDRPDRNRGGDSPSGAELLTLGVFLAVVVVVPLLAGLAIDHALGSSPAGLGGGLALGILCGFAGVYVRFRRYL
jgi:F0F1-type ATP synthase assembly protein I